MALDPQFQGQTINLGSEGPAFQAGARLEDLQEKHESLRDVVLRQGAVLAEHQGNIKGIFPAVSAVQSSLGAWLTVIGIVTSVLLGLLVFNITRTNAVGDRIDNTSQRLGAVEVRTGAVEGKLGIVNDKLALLPQQVAQRIREDQSTRDRGRGH